MDWWTNIKVLMRKLLLLDLPGGINTKNKLYYAKPIVWNIII